MARGTGGFSGADLANLINQAALRGSSLGKDYVSNDDLDHARDKIIMGKKEVVHRVALCWVCNCVVLNVAAEYK